MQPSSMAFFAMISILILVGACVGPSTDEPQNETAPVDTPDPVAPSASIDDVQPSADGGSLIVDFSTNGFDSHEAAHHVHFYFDTEDRTVVNKMYEGHAPYEIPIDDVPVDATQICIAVSDDDHDVHAEGDDCVLLPALDRDTGSDGAEQDPTDDSGSSFGGGSSSGGGSSGGSGGSSDGGSAGSSGGADDTEPQLSFTITDVSLSNDQESYRVSFDTDGFTVGTGGYQLFFYYDVQDVPEEWSYHEDDETFVLAVDTTFPHAERICAYPVSPDAALEDLESCADLPERTQPDTAIEFKRYNPVPVPLEMPENEPTLVSKYWTWTNANRHVGGNVYRPRQFSDGLNITEGIYEDERHRVVLDAGAYDGWDVYLPNVDGHITTYEIEEYIFVELDRPARVALIARDNYAWLDEKGWEATGEEVTLHDHLWERTYQVYERTFPAGTFSVPAAKYLWQQEHESEPHVMNPPILLFAEEDGVPTNAPAVPSGKASIEPNTQCPNWLHDQYYGEGPDGNLYYTWHPQVDPVYWCYFGHEHGSDPSLVGDGTFEPLYEYTAERVPQEEGHVGFKGYALMEEDDANHGRLHWYITVHGVTSMHRRVCAQFHTVTVAAFDPDSGEMLADLKYKGNFGTSRANGLDTPVINPPQCPEQHQIAQQEAEAGRYNEKKFRVANEPPHVPTGYETWRGGAKAWLGFGASGLTFDFFKPATACDTLTCEFLVPRYEPGDDFIGDGGVNRGFRISNEYWLRYNASLDPDGDGYFYTDAYGTKLVDPEQDPRGGTLQYVKPGTDYYFEKPGVEYCTRDAFSLPYTLGRCNPVLEIENGLRAPN